MITERKLPPDWAIEPIGHVLLDVQYGLSLPSNEDGNVAIVGMKGLIDGRIVVDPTERVTLSDSELDTYLLHNGDILLNRTNSPALVGKTSIFRGTEDAVFASYLVRLNVNRGKANPDFINHLLNSDAGQRKLKMLSTRAVSQANINPTVFREHFHIPLPPLVEQEIIADLLSCWDSAIEKTEQLIAATERHYSHELSRFISRVQHPQHHISEFAQEVSERNRDGACERVLSVTNDRGFVLPEHQFERRVASEDVSNYKVVCKGQYAYNPSRINVGSIARLDDYDMGVLSPMYAVFAIDEAKVNSDFFKHWLDSHEARERIKRSAQGSVRETVSFTEFATIRFPLPLLEQQQKIANYLNALRDEITLLAAYAGKLKEQKRGLMQKLLTGQWRVA